MPNERIIPHEGSTDKVTFTIKINEEEVPGKYKPLSVVVVKELSRIPFAKVTFIDGDPAKEEFTASNEEIFAPGVEMEILAGFDSQESTIFKGVIVKHGIKIRQDGTGLLKLDCRDSMFRATLAKKNRYFVDITDADAIEEIMGEYDAESSVEGLDVSHAELVQFESTDWDFVISRAEANGAFGLADDGSLTLKAPDYSQDPMLALQYGATIIEFDGEMDARSQYSGITSYSWDYADQEMVGADAAEPDGLPEAGNIPATDLADVGGIDAYSLRFSENIGQDELQAWSDAQMQHTRLAKNRGRVKFAGFAPLKPGHLIELKGLGDRFNGLVFVSAIRHDIVEGEWHSQAQFGLPEEMDLFNTTHTEKKSKKPAKPIGGLHLGIVTQLQDDPEGENRILIKLPVIDSDADGTWARIATLDAGDSRGTFFLPEIDDEVLVGFINDDPREAVVVGMLHSSAKPAPLEASNDNFEKGIITKSEMKLLFNDETKTITHETPAGKSIILDEDMAIIKFEDENGNKILMDSNGITIESSADLTLKAGSNLQLESGANTEIKAGASFKAEGSAGAEVKTDAIAVLKGSLVQIN